jgi:ribonuclease HI
MSEENFNGLTVYTDGGCSHNPGPGGWACIVIDNGQETQFVGGEKLTTNNRMELTAAIKALEAVTERDGWKGKRVLLCTDSQYVKGGITDWIEKWKEHNWHNSSKERVKNRDLWERLDFLRTQVDVVWKWVKAHAGEKYNELCDKLCKEQMAILTEEKEREDAEKFQAQLQGQG